MKKIIFFLVIFIFLAFILLLRTPSFLSFPPPLVNPSPSPSPNSLLHLMDTIVFDQQTYHFSWVKLDQLDRLRLLPNFDNQLSTQQLLQTHHCRILVNAGFYGEDNLPLGWLVSQGTTLSSAIDSRLFNGFLSLDNQYRLSIDSSLPDSPVSLGLQSGPLLIHHQQTLPLKIINDEPRRRLIAAQTDDNSLIFLAVVGADSLFDGPLLSQTPALVAAISQQINQPFIHALNLDGGSASAFRTPDIYLQELSWIGSFFCLD